MNGFELGQLLSQPRSWSYCILIWENQCYGSKYIFGSGSWIVAKFETEAFCQFWKKNLKLILEKIYFQFIFCLFKYRYKKIITPTEIFSQLSLWMVNLCLQSKLLLLIYPHKFSIWYQNGCIYTWGGCAKWRRPCRPSGSGSAPPAGGTGTPGPTTQDTIGLADQGLQHRTTIGLAHQGLQYRTQ